MIKPHKKLSPFVRLVDDDEMVLRSESFLLRMDGWQTVEYSSAEDFLAYDDTQRPGCVVLDIRMPGINGIELQRIMKEKGFDQPIIFLTGHGDIDMAVSSLKNGATDFLVKPADEEKLLQAVRKAVESNIAFRKRKLAIDERKLIFNDLTEGEKLIAPLVACGVANKVIAINMQISENAVKKRRASLMEKLNTKTIVELTDFLRDINVMVGRQSDS